ncbi:MAG: Ldh family oxidoreductase [Xanthobacteraceae bacterium]|nr:Ldh family oxidoreductase [Xanthobacteraceae bacterium]
MTDTLIAPDKLTRFAAACFERLGLAPPDARLVAETLVASNLRGVDSHGVVRLPHYATRLRNEPSMRSISASMRWRTGAAAAWSRRQRSRGRGGQGDRRGAEAAR